jgi:hypothetical protein
VGGGGRGGRLRGVRDVSMMVLERRTWAMDVVEEKEDVWGCRDCVSHLWRSDERRIEGSKVECKRNT